MRLHLLDVGHGDVGVVAAEEHERRARGLAELAGDAAPVEGHRGRHPEVVGPHRGAVGEPPAHAEAGDADRRRAVGPELIGGGGEVALQVRRGDGADHGAEVARVDVMGPREEVGCDDAVALVGEALGEAQQLGRHAVALVHDDDAGTSAVGVGGGGDGEGGEGQREVGHAPTLARFSTARIPARRARPRGYPRCHLWDKTNNPGT